MIKVEPYWNVNSRLCNDSSKNKRIKVEPYWNVNVLKVELVL